jgi:DNA-binding phage protein
MSETIEKRQATVDTGHHNRRLARRLREDPEFRAEFERQRQEIAAIDAIVNQLDALRVQHGMSKAELARAIDKNPAAIRRLLTASGNPELRTVVAIAQALGAELTIVPKPSTRRTAQALRRRRAREPTA